MYGSWAALTIGMFLLFVSLLAWVDFKEILSGKDKQDRMAEYLVIGKKITDVNAGRNIPQNLFSEEEIGAVRAAEGVRAVGKLTSNRYPVSASLGGSLGFYTELFLESVEDEFLDVIPEEWEWHPGQASVPVIMSNDFLNLYNYGFALSQGYPQLSQKSIKNIPFQINIAGGQEKYRAQIVGFTDRISSVLVPQNFMEDMNQHYGNQSKGKPSRLILKVKDPSAAQFVKFLEDKGYTVNQEQLRWNKIRTAVQAIVTSVGAVALIVVGISVLSFVLFIEITVQRAAGHISLMMQLGYAPGTLRKIIFRFFLPWLSSAILIAGGLCLILHIVMVRWLAAMELIIPYNTILPVAIFIVVMLVLLGILLARTTYGILKKI